MNDNELLKISVKTKTLQGVPLYKILHPNTHKENLEECHECEEDLLEDLKAGNYINIANRRGFSETHEGLIHLDVEVESAIMKAFNIDLNSSTTLSLLSAAIEGFQLPVQEIVKQVELLTASQQMNDTLRLIIRITAEELEASYKRSSTVPTAVTLNTIALRYEIPITDELTDLEVATLIKEKMNE